MKTRSTADLLVLLIGVTICAAVLLGLLAVGVVAVFRPEHDTSDDLAVIGDIISGLLGLMAGYLAGSKGATSSGDGGDVERVGEDG